MTLYNSYAEPQVYHHYTHLHELEIKQSHTILPLHDLAIKHTTLREETNKYIETFKHYTRHKMYYCYYMREKRKEMKTTANNIIYTSEASSSTQNTYITVQLLSALQYNSW